MWPWGSSGGADGSDAIEEVDGLVVVEVLPAASVVVDDVKGYSDAVEVAEINQTF